MSMRLLVVPLFVCAFLPRAEPHGRLIEPPSRATAWRYGFDTPQDYNDHELYCGGYTRQWVTNNGSCGVCGDPWDVPPPRDHEYGGKFYKGVIVRNYTAGRPVTIRIELTAAHNGYFEFSLCSNFKNTTQSCLDKNVLKVIRPQADVDHGGTKYYPKNGNKIYEMKYRLPKFTCKHCVLQWRYIAGNNWGNCPNGTGAVGCGPQEEFRACADIAISSKGATVDETPDYYDEATTTTTSVVPESDETYNPFGSILISIVTFLVISLILFLLYFHYYQVGRQVKNWVKGSPVKGGAVASKTNCDPPLPPPRNKRSKNSIDDRMHEISLNEDNPA